MVTRDGGVPVISHAYPGDRPDVSQFAAVVDELVARYQDLVAEVESLTVVYDAGQNSGDNHALVETHGSGSSVRCRRRITPTCWPSPTAPTVSWTPTATPGCATSTPRSPRSG